MSNYHLFSLAVVILALCYILKEQWWPQSLMGKSSHLTILILSARDNANKRETIRKTWMKDVEDYNLKNDMQLKIESKFVIGKHSCPVHPIYRDDPFGCHLKTFIETPTKLDDYHLPIRLQYYESLKSDEQVHIFRGFSFQLYHPITINTIGVHHQLVQQYQNLQVSISNVFTKNVLHRFNLSIQDLKDEHFNWINVNVQLAKDATYLVTVNDSIDVEQLQHLQSSSRFSSIPGKFLRSYKNSKVYDSVPFDLKNSFHVVNINYSFSDVEKLETFITSYPNHSKAWNQRIMRLEEQIQAEMKQHDDILLVDQVDIYRNLPDKLLKSLTWLQSTNTYPTHVLKTDDDCYLNIANIVKLLKTYSQQNFAMFANFRTNWPVNYYGKWAERGYTSPVYPKYPCGTGYILTGDLVDWLADNSDHLYRYQGEDVSLGIWLAATNIKLVEDSRWVCSNQQQFNIDHVFAIAQLQPEQMHLIHSRKKKKKTH